MKLFKIHKDIEIDKRFGNVRISTFKYSKPIENSDKWEHYTEVSCWYDNDCENCENDNYISLWEIYWNFNDEDDLIDTVEVIGNIFDNKELLESEEK